LIAKNHDSVARSGDRYDTAETLACADLSKVGDETFEPGLVLRIVLGRSR
jgi:hypothetical protein